MSAEPGRCFAAVPISNALRADLRTADRVELVRSHLGGGAARYETLAAITLGVPAGV